MSILNERKPRIECATGVLGERTHDDSYLFKDHGFPALFNSWIDWPIFK